MKKKKVFSALTLLTFSTLLIAGCAGGANSATDKSSAASSSTAVSSSAEAAKEQSKGQELTEILSSTDWQGTKVYDILCDRRWRKAYLNFGYTKLSSGGRFNGSDER